MTKNDAVERALKPTKQDFVDANVALKRILDAETIEQQKPLYEILYRVLNDAEQALQTSRPDATETYHLSSAEQGVMRNALRKSVKVLPDADRLAIDRAIDAIDLALRDSRCAFGILKTGKPDDACDHLLHKNCEKALTSLDYLRAALKSGDKGRCPDEAIKNIKVVMNELKMMAHTSAGDPALLDDMKFYAMNAGRLERALSDLPTPSTSEGV